MSKVGIIEFTPKQTELLLQALRFRQIQMAETRPALEELNSSETNKDFFRRRLDKPLQSCIDKVQSGGTDIFVDWEIDALVSCANQSIYAIQDQLELIHDPAPVAWATNDHMRSKRADLDTYKDIIEKTGFYKTSRSLTVNDTFRYRDVYAVVDKMKASETLFYSSVNENEIYKLAFVHANAEIFSMSLFHAPPLKHERFCAVNKEQLNEHKKSYTGKLTRDKMLNLLQGSNQLRFADGVMEFLHSVLSQ